MYLQYFKCNAEYADKYRVMEYLFTYIFRIIDKQAIIKSQYCNQHFILENVLYKRIAKDKNECDKNNKFLRCKQFHY